MPIYAYQCESCGHQLDVLQKMSDAPLLDCPNCHASSLRKQVTAAGFQLKGSGWYVTDFKGGSGATKPAKAADGDTVAADKPTEKADTSTQAVTQTADASSNAASPATAPAAAKAAVAATSLPSSSTP
ncbi:MAG: FmdB family zinc ribbon protein [Burkholderiaceae bacterium]